MVIPSNSENILSPDHLNRTLTNQLTTDQQPLTIHSFIQSQVLRPRLQQHGVLIVYDPDQRYRDLCLEIASENRIIVDAGVSSIEARESGNRLRDDGDQLGESSEQRNGPL